MEVIRYFILDRVSPNEFQALSVCIGRLDTQRYSLDFTKLAIKTTQKNIDNYLEGDISILGAEFNEESMRNIMHTLEWEKVIGYNL